MLRAAKFAVLFLAILALALAGLRAIFHVPEPGPGAPRVLVAVDRTLWHWLGLDHVTHVRKLRLAGLEPLLVTYSEDRTVDPSLFDAVGGLVLSGGGDVAAERYGGNPALVRGVKPSRDSFELGLLQLAEQRSLPVLGLCRGAQLLNVFYGGTLGDFRSDTPRFRRHRNAFRGHAVEFGGGSQLARIYDVPRLNEVTTWHGQYVDEPGQGFVISGRSPDGTPEAIEYRGGDRFMIGVQWHPEMPPWDATQAPLFDAFAEAVRAAGP